jgi:hypothetical protein
MITKLYRWQKSHRGWLLETIRTYAHHKETPPSNFTGTTHHSQVTRLPQSFGEDREQDLRYYSPQTFSFPYATTGDMNSQNISMPPGRRQLTRQKLHNSKHDNCHHIMASRYQTLPGAARQCTTEWIASSTPGKEGSESWITCKIS